MKPIWKTLHKKAAAAAAAAKSLQSCPTPCNPIDGSPPGSAVPGILQARTLEWVAISFSNAWKWKVKVKSLSHVQLLATPWTVAYQAPASMGFSRQEYWSGLPFPSPSGLPGPHHLPKFAQVHVHCIGDAIQLSHSLMPSSPSALDLSQHEGLFSESSVLTRWPKYRVSASVSVLPTSIQAWFPLRWTGSISLLSNWLPGVFSSTIVRRHQFLGISPSLKSSSHNCMWPLGRP